jgi:hypothetical protein
MPSRRYLHLQEGRSARRGNLGLAPNLPVSLRLIGPDALSLKYRYLVPLDRRDDLPTVCECSLEL